MGVVRGYSRAIPRLQAEEQLMQMQIATMANSSRFDQQDVRRIQQQIEQIASGGVRKRAKRASAAALSAMGIARVSAPAPSAPEAGGAANV